MRLGGQLFDDYQDPESWAALVKAARYRAALCPVTSDASDEEIKSYIKTAKDHDIVIAEVGVWNNPLSEDAVARKAAIAYCKEQLALADRIGANCCVNIAGSMGPIWDGPDEKNYSPETFDFIVETVREIIDSVKPSRTFYTLEPMPYMLPDSIESYLELIKTINRKAFAVHLDPVNMITNPRRYYANGNFLKECFKQLGPYIKSCHAKDVLMTEKFVVHISETTPGKGILDYKTYIREINKLNKELPLIIEHLPKKEDYDTAADYILSVAEGL